MYVTIIKNISMYWPNLTLTLLITIFFITSYNYWLLDISRGPYSDYCHKIVGFRGFMGVTSTKSFLVMRRRRVCIEVKNRWLIFVRLLHTALSNIFPTGPKFTWRGIQGGGGRMLGLDWTYFWLPLAGLRTFLPHDRWTLTQVNPIIFPFSLKFVLSVQGKKRKNKRFRFEEMWLREDDCKKVIETGWAHSTGGDPLSLICNKITNTREFLMDWSWSRFGNLKKEITRTRSQLAFFFYQSMSASPVPDRLTLESRLNDLLHQEQTFWRQYSNVFWLTNGDMNTKFFHQRANNERRI